jgi:hypothetical protein
MGLDNTIKDQLTLDGASADTISGNANADTTKTMDAIVRSERPSAQRASRASPSEEKRSMPGSENLIGLPAATYLEVKADDSVASAKFSALNEEIGNRQPVSVSSSDVLEASQSLNFPNVSSALPANASAVGGAADRAAGTAYLAAVEALVGGTNNHDFQGYLNTYGWAGRKLLGVGPGQTPSSGDINNYNNAPSVAEAVGYEVMRHAASAGSDRRRTQFTSIPDSVYCPPLVINTRTGVPQFAPGTSQRPAWDEAYVQTTSQVVAKVAAWINARIGAAPPVPSPTPPDIPPPVIGAPPPGSEPTPQPPRPYELGELIVAMETGNTADMQKIAGKGSLVDAVASWIKAKPGRESTMQQIADANPGLAADILYYTDQRAYVDSSDPAPRAITETLHKAFVKDYKETTTTDGSISFTYDTPPGLAGLAEASLLTVARNEFGQDFALVDPSKPKFEASRYNNVASAFAVPTQLGAGASKAGEQAQGVFYNETVKHLANSKALLVLNSWNYFPKIKTYLDHSRLNKLAFEVLNYSPEAGKVFDRMLQDTTPNINGIPNGIVPPKSLYSDYKAAAGAWPGRENAHLGWLRDFVLEKSSVGKLDESALKKASVDSHFMYDVFTMGTTQIDGRKHDYAELTTKEKKSLDIVLALGKHAPMQTQEEKTVATQFLSAQFDVSNATYAETAKPETLEMRGQGLTTIVQRAAIENAKDDDTNMVFDALFKEYNRLAGVLFGGAHEPEATEATAHPLAKISLLIRTLGEASNAASDTAPKTGVKIAVELATDKLVDVAVNKIFGDEGALKTKYKDNKSAEAAIDRAKGFIDKKVPEWKTEINKFFIGQPVYAKDVKTNKEAVRAIMTALMVAPTQLAGKTVTELKTNWTKDLDGYTSAEREIVEMTASALNKLVAIVGDTASKFGPALR